MNGTFEINLIERNLSLGQEFHKQMMETILLCIQAGYLLSAYLYNSNNLFF